MRSSSSTVRIFVPTHEWCPMKAETAVNKKDIAEMSLDDHGKRFPWANETGSTAPGRRRLIHRIGEGGKQRGPRREDEAVSGAPPSRF